MAFPTTTDADFDPDPCDHFFPYTITDGCMDVSPCEKCGALWADRNKGFRGCQIWGRTGALGPVLVCSSDVDSEPDPGWFAF
jgi:hypothetical protein